MAIKEFKLPDIGEGIAEGEIVSWKVKPGQTVKEEDEFVEVMTDKATVMITVPYDGVVTDLKAKEGDIVPVESVIAREIVRPAAISPSTRADASVSAARNTYEAESVERRGDGNAARPASSTSAATPTSGNAAPPCASGTASPVHPSSTHCFHRPSSQPGRSPRS